MQKLLFILVLLKTVGLNAQNSIVHTIDINPESRVLEEKIEISTTAEYLFKIHKKHDLKGRKVRVSPDNYRRVTGDWFDFLLFDSPKIEVIYSEELKDDQFNVSDDGLYTVAVDFNYNYLSGNPSVDYDSTTNNTISSFVQIDGDYEIVNYRFNPEIGSKTLDGNKIEFKGNVNKMHIEIDYRLKQKVEDEPKLTNAASSEKETVVQKTIDFRGTITLSVWDDVQEDGDIISLWLGEICLAKNLRVSKEKVHYKITKEMFGDAKSLKIRIDNVDEGSVPPNTVLVELRGDGVNENLRIHTTENVSKEIVLKKK